MARPALGCDRSVRSRFPSAHQIKKSRQRLCVRFSFASELFMKNGIARSCGLFALTLLCGNTSLSPVIAQQPQQPREGIITTFAPVVEKVAPSVVTVFTTQTVSRGQTAFRWRDSQDSGSGSYAPANADTQAASHSRF